MKNIFLAFAKYMKRADESVLALIDNISPELRTKDRGAYYKSINGLILHILGGTLYFLKLFNDSMENKKETFSGLKDISPPESIDDEESYNEIKEKFSFLNNMTIELIKSITENDLIKEIKINWYKERSSVPFHFLYNQLFVTNIHHRGQLSQILDEMKIDHDFSGIDLEFL